MSRPARRVPRIRRTDGSPASRKRGERRGFDLGTRVRALRAAKGLSLQELSDRCGISRSALSKIENGQLSPTYEKILALARGFSVDITALFAEQALRTVKGRCSVTRRGQGIFYDTDNYRYELLCPDLTGKHMVPLRAHIKAKERKSFGPLVSHEGEEAIYVLTGRITLHTEFYRPISLAEGDCAYFDSQMEHGLVLEGEEEATVFWVCSSERVEELLRRDAGHDRFTP